MARHSRTVHLTRWNSTDEWVQRAELGELRRREQLCVDQLHTCRGQPAGIIGVVNTNRLAQVVAGVTAQAPDRRAGQEVADRAVTGSVGAEDFTGDSATI